MDTIIFDIDGTLADVEHRRHHVARGKKNWGKFFDEMVNDPPLADVCLLAETLGWAKFDNNRRPTIFFFSGRPETHRKQTEDWLEKHVPVCFRSAEALLMRGENDQRADTIVKKEMLDHVQKLGFVVRLVIDDRPSVVQMWKDNGITVLAHDSGEWDGVVKTWKPGTLHLMVGPSGAGKTSFIAKYYATLLTSHQVVSSDDLRREITGNMMDQSANDQVFAALHAIVKARVECGLPTVVDATNIAARNRRTLRDLCPADTEFYYHVIDRPLAEKIKTAGWRSKIMVGKEGHELPLVEAHHKRFKSAVKHILAGDDDPRVQVHDYRDHDALKWRKP